ncbi:alpha-1,2-fucosyltransferase [Phytoactinopolyspora limicola]|uniref:alpha-1,2-fucosyltransferase n=1 Tax=Phytoactinopolyspora limicola TaxID=2715536 RepID=UPI00140753A9|nr:alpha-1,2-fucosyltransferase [Phytoactinopolyspora limicola]
MMLGSLVSDLPRVPRLVGLAMVAAQRASVLRGGPLPLLVAEQGFGYDSSVRDRVVAGGRAGTYILGYFQSYRYFEDVAPVVRETVNAYLAEQLTPAGQRLRTDLAADSRTVAVHVRRGDYVTNPVAAAYHGVLGIDFYQRALDTVAKSGHTRRIWFSDDLPWVRQHLAGPDDEFCPAGVARSAGGEIALMAACSARIIANSSFSWWAGWLGREGSRVVAPDQWFAGSGTGTEDLVPTEWVRQ